MILVILIAASDTPPSLTDAMREATSEALGPAARVQVRGVKEAANDGRVLDVERELGAQVVAALTWDDAEHLRARLRIHVAESGRWADRRVAFELADELGERGRALGFAVASMIPDATSAPPPDERAVASARGAADEGVSWPPRAAASVRAIGSVGVGGPASGGGVGADFELFLGRQLALRVGGGMRNGTATKLPGSHFSSYVAAGMAWWAVVPSRRDRGFGVAMRLQARALRDDVTPAAVDGTTPPRDGRWVPGSDVALEMSFMLGRHLALAAAAGAEVAFGVTDLYVKEGDMQERRKDTIPVLRAIAEAGVRLQF